MLGLLPFIGALIGQGRSTSGDPLEAQKQFAHQQEWRAAEAAMLKSKTDTTNGISAGVMDSSNKSMSAIFASAKGISY